MKLSLVLAFATAISANAAAIASGPAAAGAGFEVERYAVSLTPNPAGMSVTGTEAITVRSLRDGLRSIVFSPNALVIDGATAGGRATRVTSDERGTSIV